MSASELNLRRHIQVVSTCMFYMLKVIWLMWTTVKSRGTNIMYEKSTIVYTSKSYKYDTKFVPVVCEWLNL